jgi:hypothetical protein
MFSEKPAMGLEKQASELEQLCAEQAMAWYGWGSPVGLGFMLLCIGGFLVCLHDAGLF